jgi:hypothetical protein
MAFKPLFDDLVSVKSKLVSERLFYHLNVTYDSNEPKDDPNLFGQIFDLEASLEDLDDRETTQLLFETAQRNSQDCSSKMNKAYKLFVQNTWAEI